MKEFTYFGKRITIFSALITSFVILVIGIVFYTEKKASLIKQEHLILKNTHNLLNNTMEISIESIKNDTLMLSKVPPIQGIIRAIKGKGIDKDGNSTIAEWTERLMSFSAAFLYLTKSISMLVLLE